MGERAHQAYEEDAKRAFRALPPGLRIRAYLRAAMTVAMIAFLIVWLFAYPQARAIWALMDGK